MAAEHPNQLDSTRAAGIQASGVRRAFGSVVAVAGIDIEAPSGQVTGLIGPNGSGKTTLLLILAGLLRPDAGQIRVAGFDPFRDPRAVRSRLGWMPDVFGTWESLSCCWTSRPPASTPARASAPIC